MPKFQRETATESKDLPHRFVGEEARCEDCATPLGDARHLAWERQTLHDRERAQRDGFEREIGS